MPARPAGPRAPLRSEPRRSDESPRSASPRSPYAGSRGFTFPPSNSVAPIVVPRHSHNSHAHAHMNTSPSPWSQSAILAAMPIPPRHERERERTTTRSNRTSTSSVSTISTTSSSLERESIFAMNMAVGMDKAAAGCKCSICNRQQRRSGLTEELVM